MKRYLFFGLFGLCGVVSLIAIFRFLSVQPQLSQTTLEIQAGTGKNLQLSVSDTGLKLGAVQLGGHSDQLKLTIVTPRLTAKNAASEVIVSAPGHLPPGDYTAVFTANGGFFTRAISVEVKVLPEPGSLDITFGKEGRVFIDTGLDRYAKVHTTSDGKIMVLSWEPSYMGDEVTVDPRLVKLTRLNADGSSDSTFGQGGTLRFHTPGGIGVENAYFSRDGQHIYTLSFEGILLRYTLDGTLDSNFTKSKVGEEMVGTLYHLSEDSLGRIVFANAEGYILRLNPDGSRDATFAQSGAFKVPAPSKSVAYSGLAAIIVDGNRPVFVQVIQRFDPESYTLRLGRVTETGKMDDSFGNNGFTDTIPHNFTFEADGPPLYVDGLLLSQQGYLLSRWLINNSGSDFNQSETLEVSRYNRSGVRDLAFADRGRKRFEYNSQAGEFLNALDVVLADGEIPMQSEKGVGLLDTTGDLDVGFAASGFRRYEPEGSTDMYLVTGIAQDAINRLVMVGIAEARGGNNSTSDESNNDLFVLRVYP